jgi:hypothetical protein
MILTKLDETATTITLGWVPINGTGGYVLYANGQVVSVATANFKDGTPRNSAKFSKTSPGPPFQIAALVRISTGAFSVDVGTYPIAPVVVFPSPQRYPSEAIA